MAEGSFQRRSNDGDINKGMLVGFKIGIVEVGVSSVVSIDDSRNCLAIKCVDSVGIKHLHAYVFSLWVVEVVEFDIALKGRSQ